jgi:translocation and assembly module TamA
MHLRVWPLLPDPCPLPFARRAWAAVLTAMAALLAAPSVPAQPAEPTPAAAASAPAAPPTAAPASAPPATPVEPPAATPPDGPAEAAAPVAVWRLQVDAPGELQALLAQHLDLARFQRAEGVERLARAELSRLVAAAPAQARALAETLGYFSAQVQARIASAPPGEPVVVQVRVEPGPRTMVRSTRIEFEGALSVAADAGDRVAMPLTARVRREWPLPPGAPFTQPQWSAAKNATLALLRAEGYLAVSVSGSSAQVDAPAASAELYTVVDSGPLFHFGRLDIEGLSKVRESVVENLSPFGPGAAYREQMLLDFQDRLVKTGLFDSVAVVVEPDPDMAQAVPVKVRLRERPRHQVTLGAGVSDLTGPRVTVEHIHQNVFDFAWQSKTKLELGKTQSVLQLDLTSHPKSDMWRNLVSGAASRSEVTGLIVNSRRARVGRSQDAEHIDRLYYVEWQRATSRPDAADRQACAEAEARIAAGESDVTNPCSDASSVTGNYQWTWRGLDNPILPTRGIAATAEVGAGYSFSTSQQSGRFTRVRGRITAFWPFADTWYLQVRGEAGEVFSGDGVTVPITLLFRAGGDESVRGYGYQTLGPEENGSAVGGRVLAAGSVELARPFSRKTPAWWGAVFVDAGNAADQWEGFSGALGYGFGVRWRSPVGPLRVDLARGVDLVEPKWRLHFSVGIVF